MSFGFTVGPPCDKELGHGRSGDRSRPDSGGKIGDLRWKETLSFNALLLEGEEAGRQAGRQVGGAKR